jgi:hypothetical protein
VASPRMWKLSITRAVSPPPVLPDPADPGVQAWRDADGRVYAYAHALGARSWMHLPGLASFCCDTTRERVDAIPHHPARRDLIRDAYYRHVLPMALQASEREVLHASAIRARRGVLALCGVSGAGKSTVAFALGRRGHRAWADDAVALEFAGAHVTAIPLPFGFRLREPSRSFFAQSATSTGTPLPERRQHSRVGTPAPLVALAILRRQSRDGYGVDVEPLTPTQAFPALLSHACFFNLGDRPRKRRMLRNYLAVVDKVPVYEIRFPAGLQWLPSVLDAVEQLIRDT